MGEFKPKGPNMSSTYSHSGSASVTKAVNPPLLPGSCDTTSMPKRSHKVQKKRKPARRDENQSAFDAVQRVIAMTEGGTIPLTPEGKNPLAQALGRLGGLKGGRTRVDRMTKAELKASASKAAKARWARKANK